VATIDLTVGASDGDAHGGSISNDSGRTVTSGASILSTNGVNAINDLTDPKLSPGSHGSNAEASVAARFTNVTVPQGATITSASFSLKAQANYGPGSITIAYLVSAEASDDAPALTTSASSGGSLRISGAPAPTVSRPRTTAVSSVWNQNSVTAGTRYSIDVTSVVQEIVSRSGWASGNALLIIVDTDSTTTQGEWQDYYSWDDATDRTNNPPQLSITYSSGAVSLSPAQATPVLTGQALSLGFTINMPDEA
jgi:hypothetical protein